MREWYTSDHCLSGAHCNICRGTTKDCITWRLRIAQVWGDFNPNGECPFGRAWGYCGTKRVKPRKIKNCKGCKDKKDKFKERITEEIRL